MTETTIPMPPPCACCGATALANHAEDCNHLAAMRAQDYPTSLGLNGRSWYQNLIDKQQAKEKIYRDALERICAIQNKMEGADWCEIDEAREISAEALGGEI